MKRSLSHMIRLTFLISMFSGAVLAVAARDARADGGLAERRAIKEYQEKKYAGLEKQIHDIAGPEVKVTVDWDKLAVPGQSAQYVEDSYLSNTVFLPLIAALKDITKDEMGKSALKSKLKEITVSYDENTAPASNYKNGVTFEGGVLAINFRPGSNSDGPGETNFKDRTDAIRETMEPKL